MVDQILGHHHRPLRMTIGFRWTKDQSAPAMYETLRRKHEAGEEYVGPMPSPTPDGVYQLPNPDVTIRALVQSVTETAVAYGYRTAEVELSVLETTIKPPPGQVVSDKMEPALTAQEWATLRLWLAGKTIGGHVRGKVVLDLAPDQQRAAIAVANAALPADDPRKITRDTIAFLREIAEGPYAGLWSERARSIADALESYLPPE